MAYEAVRQLLKVDGNIVDVSKGVAILMFACHYCNKETLVDPNDQASQDQVKDFLKVQRADGSSYAFCDYECLRSGSRYFGKHRLEVNPEAQGSKIVLTDAEAEQMGDVDENDASDVEARLERLRAIARGE
jgi:hypothetical protein